jgi:addiction module HigA family antidote
MAEYGAARDPDRQPAHPGALLRESIEAAGRGRAEIAAALGISRQHLYDITEGRKRVSPEVAVRIGKLLGNGGSLWLMMQAAHDLWRAERDVDTSKIKTIEKLSA